MYLVIPLRLLAACAWLIALLTSERRDAHAVDRRAERAARPGTPREDQLDRQRRDTECWRRVAERCKTEANTAEAALTEHAKNHGLTVLPYEAIAAAEHCGQQQVEYTAAP
ncbi:hypothetical protein OG292_27100 [Streptomyces sp. NBC_01511]|uniref:hypothetical protein n=1 Tax=unclassified Streptomyces TaxID=2593676 RepID=UPI00386DBA4F